VYQCTCSHDLQKILVRLCAPGSVKGPRRDIVAIGVRVLGSRLPQRETPKRTGRPIRSRRQPKPAFSRRPLRLATVPPRVVVATPRQERKGERERETKIASASTESTRWSHRRDLKAVYSDLGRGGIRPLQLRGPATSSSSARLLHRYSRQQRGEERLGKRRTGPTSAGAVVGRASV
jgi:hypothetical protein